MMKQNFFLLLFFSSVIFYGCDQIVSTCEDDTPARPKMTFTYLQDNVFTPLCVGCHGNTAPQGKLDLSPGNSYANLINRASTSSSLLRVKPGDSQNSYLMVRLRGEGGKTVMPPAGRLETALIDSIAAWINREAPQD